jgi:pilus assembly protein CpaB
MKKNNLVKLLGIALVVAIVSTGIFYGLFVGKLSSSTGTGRTLVVAAKTLAPGTVLKTSDLKLIPWSAKELPKGAFERADQVTGETVFNGIAEGEPVMAERLASPASGGGAGVPEGMRAVSIHASDSSGVLELLRPGQNVDVQVVLSKRDDPRATEVRTALEDLKVLSVLSKPEHTSQGADVQVVTLLAQPAQADILAAADAGARIRLTLRNPLDEATRAPALLTLDTVMRAGGEAGASRGSAPPAPKQALSRAGSGGRP